MEDLEYEKNFKIKTHNQIKELIKKTLLEYNGELIPIQCLALAYYDWKVNKKPMSDLFSMLSEISAIVDEMAEEVKEEREKIFWEEWNKYFREYFDEYYGKGF